MTTTHIHVTPIIKVYDTYTLPRGVRFVSNLKKPIEALEEKSTDHIFTFLTTPGHTITAKNSLTHLDNQTSGPKNCFNLQLQMNGGGKTTVAQALLDDDLKDTCCSICKVNIISAFFIGINESFKESRIAATHVGDRGPLEGKSFIITAPSHPKETDE